jgi:CubicO group peptidase (beta-lactamase class C family)/outer membrane protein OmpA-like peptidoglycan-associated protein
MKMKFLPIFSLLVFSTATVYSQNINKPKLDSLFNILASKNQAMGSLTISKNGTILYNRSIGYSFISNSGKKASSNLTKYRIGSITKTFTATMIFQLIEEGKINLNTTLNNYFPKLPNSKIITIGNLLNHTSGLHECTDIPNYQAWKKLPKTQDEMLSIISKFKVDFQPNEKSLYSNSNYLILGYIIEKITKKSYSENLNELITSKIGLSDTYYGNRTNVNNDESFSYEYKNNWKQLSETNMTIPVGAGAIVSKPEDLTKFIEALFSLKLVSQSSLLQMKTLKEHYGMGLVETPFYGKTGYGHNGRIDGFRSFLVYFPDDSIAVSYITNGEVYPFDDICKAVLCICFNKDYTIPTFFSITDTKELDKYLGVYSNPQYQSKITISKNNTTLIVQTTGESTVLLDATEKDKFAADEAGIFMEFNPDKKELMLKKDNGVLIFKQDSILNKNNVGNSDFGNKDEQINNFTGNIYFIPEGSKKLPDLRKLEPVGKIYSNYIYIKKQDFKKGFPGVSARFENFAIDYKGQFYIKEESDYCFAVGSDDGSKLFIDDSLIINNDFIHSLEFKSNCINLKKGLHKIEVQYFQGPRYEVALILRYKKMGEKAFQLFDLSLFFPVKINENDSSIDVSMGNDILFEFNSFELSEAYKLALSEIKRIIIDKVKFQSIIIYGHTDDTGTEAYNMKLSLNRANAVKNYLTTLGIDTKSTITKGCGEKQPKVPNTDDENRKENRRIEISIIKDK